MFALLDGHNYFPDIFAVLCDRVTNVEISQGNLVSEGYILERRELNCGPGIKGYASGGLRGVQISDGHTNRITTIMHKEIGQFHSSLSILAESRQSESATSLVHWRSFYPPRQRQHRSSKNDPLDRPKKEPKAEL